MAFWEEWKLRQHSFYQYTDTLRGERLGLRTVDSALDQLGIHKRGFENLRSTALSERNSAVALGKLNESIGKVSRRIDQILDARNHVLRQIESTEREIQAQKEGIAVLQGSIRDDEWKLRQTGRHTSNRALDNIHQRLRDKEKNLDRKKDRLEDLQDRLRRLRS